MLMIYQNWLLISKLENELNELLESHYNWRKNAISFTSKYIKLIITIMQYVIVTQLKIIIKRRIENEIIWIW